MDDEQRPWWTRPPEPGPPDPDEAGPPPAPRRPSRPQLPPADFAARGSAVRGVTEAGPTDPGPDHPRFDGPGFDGPGFDGPGFDGPGFDGPGFDGPGFDDPDAADAADPERTNPDLAAVDAPLIGADAPTASIGTDVADVEAPVEPPPPPPRPPRPVVRRVAVVPPTPPRGVPAARAGDRTQVLPPVRDDIFATFGPPAAPAPTGRRPARAPLDDGPDEPRPPRRSRRPTLPEPRVMLMAAGAGLVTVLVILLVVLLGGDPSDRDPSTAAGQPSASPSARTGIPDGLRELGADDATALLRRAGQEPGGRIVEAWEWNDANGRNLMVNTVEAVAGDHRTLRVIHVADLEDDPRTLRVMTDPDLPADCTTAGAAGFTPKSTLIRDLDEDDVAEVITGWASRCGDEGTPGPVKLALITGGDKYILRGEGVPGEAGEATADPARSRWPDEYLRMVTARYDRLYR